MRILNKLAKRAKKFFHRPMKPVRMEEICQALEARRRMGDGAGYLLGEHRGWRFPVFGIGRMRTIGLSRKTGIPVEELEEFRELATPEITARISLATDKFRQGQKKE